MRWLWVVVILVCAGCAVAPASPSPARPAAPPRSAPSWAQIDHQHATLTGAQWAAYVATLTDAAYTDLPATVVDAKEPIAGLGYVLYLKTADSSDLYQFTADLPAADAVRYNRGQAVIVTGTIHGVSCTMWCSIALEAVTIRSPTPIDR